MPKKLQVVGIALIIFLLAASRLVEHPYNFTPIMAMALFAGCYLRRYWGLILPLGAMLVSDYFIGFYDWQVMLSVYASIALIYGVGKLLARNKKWYTVALASISGSVLFFLITNFAVWAFFSWYPHTWQGLTNCFVLALPFFRNALAGDLFYASAIFGLYELVLLWMAKRAVREQVEI